MNESKIVTESKLSFEPFFRWYDLWIGVFVDTKKSAVYICPVPMFGLKIQRTQIACCPDCGHALLKEAHNTGDGWALGWSCEHGRCYFHEVIEWPFGDAWMMPADLRAFGYEVT